MNSSRHILAIAGVALLLTSLAACSAQPNVSPTPMATQTPTAAAQVNNRAYTKADLESILGAVNTKLHLDGAVAITDGPNTAASDPLSAAVGNSPTITPASCANFTNFNSQLADLLGTTRVIVGTTSGPHLNLILATVSGGVLPASLKASFATGQSALLTSCEHLTITAPVDGTIVSATIDSTPLHVTTDATQSVGFSEKEAITSGGAGSTTASTWIEATDGNLLIFVTSVIDQDQTGLENAVNAAVASAR
jgi:hypothetical protein